MKTVLAFIVSLVALAACSDEKEHLVIGVSQCSDDEWRTQMNREMLREALFYPETEVKIRSAKDNSGIQIEDIETFIKERVDALVVSPNEAETVTPVIEKAFDAGIPVILVDRKIHSGKYTAYVGADNYDIGRRAGFYIVNRLHGKGHVVEITGLRGSTSAEERHRGFMDALAESPEMEVVARADAGFFQQKAEDKFDSILARHKDIDLVFAQNDRMAIGAYQAALKCGRQKDMLFVGIDAVSGEGYGVEKVASGELDATFIYPTSGDKVMQVVMAVLEGKPYDRDTKLQTALVDKSNARVMEMQTEHIFELDKKIEYLNKKVDAYFLRYSSQRMFLYACIVILLLVGALLVFVVRAFWTKTGLMQNFRARR